MLITGEVGRLPGLWLQLQTLMVLYAAQEITCGALAADPGYLQGFRRSKAPGRPAAVSRAICVLDKPLQVPPPMSMASLCHHCGMTVFSCFSGSPVSQRSDGCYFQDRCQQMMQCKGPWQDTAPGSAWFSQYPACSAAIAPLLLTDCNIA